MPEVTITYKRPTTLKILKGLAKFLDFKISPKKDNSIINGVTIIPGDKTADLSALSELFTGKNIDAKKLREEAWKKKR